jgi:hypothetical protein
VTEYGTENPTGSPWSTVLTSMPSEAPVAGSTRTVIEYAVADGWTPIPVIWPLTAPLRTSGR